MASKESNEYQYASLEGDEVNGATIPKFRMLRKNEPWLKSSLTIVAIILLSAFAGSISGFLAARSRTPVRYINSTVEHPLTLDTVDVTFIANRSYIERNSPETKKLWVELYPKDTHGHFKWPDHNPQRTGFAGFHQLHCVDMLREKFWQDHDIKEALKKGEDPPKFEKEIDMNHSLHCVEFMRQSVMCNADTNLQTEASYHRGIVAFGWTYQCRDWFQMVNWVNERNAKLGSLKYSNTNS